MRNPATDELLDEWPGSLEQAVAYLTSRGYLLTKDWRWDRSCVAEITGRDISAIGYLIAEWDFGGIAYGSSSAAEASSPATEP